MGVKPEEFFDVINQLLGGNDKPREILSRTAINRLYYGVMHWLQHREGYTVDAALVERYHAEVRDYIRHHPVWGQLISDQFNNLYDLRVIVDYKLEDPVRNRDLQDAIILKNEILQKVENSDKFIGFESDEDFYKRFNH